MRAAITWPELTAVVLAGGGGTRLGGKDKPMLTVAGVPMLDRVLAALEGAGRRIVVGPARVGLPAGVLTVREEPAGAGPAAATAAALALMPAEAPATASPGGLAGKGSDLVGVFAADLPHLTPEAVQVLVSAVDGGTGRVDGAVFVDERGKRQLLCGVWRGDALRRGVERLGDPVGKSMRAVFGGLVIAEVRWERDGPSPYFDCDTEEDLSRASGASQTAGQAGQARQARRAGGSGVEGVEW
ncbi:molybdenum cofactor guanylyltransferase [Dactylosporangium cerinum]|uniref:Molybdenum cofactor guanylyltransferase n=1 Tax=Dactylosporangium cerinum TaxID=1434730 RepID=A0ABV9WBS2_9ACTN